MPDTAKPEGFATEGMIARIDLVTVHDYSSNMALIPTNTVQISRYRNDFLFQPRLLTKRIIEYRVKKSILMCEKEKTAPAKLLLAPRLMVWLPGLVGGAYRGCLQTDQL